MNVEKIGDELRLTLAPDEARLLKLSLQRACFMDTPASDQAEIARFCDAFLEALDSPGS